MVARCFCLGDVVLRMGKNTEGVYESEVDIFLYLCITKQ